MKTAFNIAKELCSIPTYSGWDIPRSIDKIDTPRIKFIESFLNQNNIAHYSKVYDVGDGNVKNIYVPFILNPRLETILITAHHDILNASSMNYNDNTSSLALLLNWCRNFDHSKNIFVAFTDNEERGMKGIDMLFDDIDPSLKFYMHIDVDTAGIGNTILYDEYNTEAEKDFIINNIFNNYNGEMKMETKSLPSNQAMFSNLQYNVDSMCITRAPKENNELNLDIWSKIHTIDDVILNKYESEFDLFEKSFSEIIHSIAC